MKAVVYIGYSEAVVMDLDQVSPFVKFLEKVNFCAMKGFGADATFVPKPVNDICVRFIEDSQLQTAFPEEGDNA